MTPEERAAGLEAIAAEVRACTVCRLHRSRTHAVPGEGSPETEVLFVGEGPGQNEDLQGRPFVGAAGGLLTELLETIGWRRQDVFITNVVKCRPPGNRDPEPDEIAACAPFLRRQLQLLDPAVVVTLGRHSLGTYMPGARISGVHGTTRRIDPGAGASSAVAFAMYHPAAAFRQAALKETLVADMANLPQVLIDAREARSRMAASATAAHDAARAPEPFDAAAEPGTLGPALFGRERGDEIPPTRMDPPVPAQEPGPPGEDLHDLVAATAAAAEPVAGTDQMTLF